MAGQQATYVGQVRWFNATKGFGFIGSCDRTTDWPQAKDKDVFVHYTTINEPGYKTLTEGQYVSFAVTDGSGNRLQADQVQKLGENADQTVQVAEEVQEQEAETSL